MVQKTLAYERDDEPGEWRHRLTVLAGVPAYNPLVDRLVETMAFAASTGSTRRGPAGPSTATRSRGSACRTIGYRPRR